MTDTKQPEALRLAQFCKAIARGLLVKPYIEDLNAAAALLKNQHTEITELCAKLEELEKQEPDAYIQRTDLEEAMRSAFLCVVSRKPRRNRVELDAAIDSALAASKKEPT